MCYILSMKKLFYLFIFLALLITPAFSIEVDGGVSYTVDTARDYVNQGQTDNVDVSGPVQFKGENTQKVVYSYNNDGEVVGITVEYINNPKKDYIYNKNKKLIAVDIYDKPIDTYPHRGYRYDLSGSLLLKSLTVSKNEMFRFAPDGHLIAHSKNGIITDEDGNVIGSGK